MSAHGARLGICRPAGKPPGKAAEAAPAPRRCAPDIFVWLLYHGPGAGFGPPPEEGLMERRLAAILAADVVGYTRLMGVDEAGTLARLKALRARR